MAIKHFSDNELYMKKENRDKRYKELKAAGYTDLIRRSYHNQLIHPMYVEDFPDKRIKEESGFGNPYYKTYFKTLYAIESRW